MHFYALFSKIRLVCFLKIFFAICFSKNAGYVLYLSLFLSLSLSLTG